MESTFLFGMREEGGNEIGVGKEKKQHQEMQLL